MPRKFFKKYMPDPKNIKENRFLKIFGDFIHDPQLWHLNRSSASGAFAVGFFCAFIPVPFQMVVAAAFAILFRVNLPISVALVWVTNPLTIPPMFYGAYKVGAWVLNTPEREFDFVLSMDWLAQELSIIWQPFLLGCLICGIIFALIGYYGIQALWRYHVVSAWRARKAVWKEEFAKRLHLETEKQQDSEPQSDKVKGLDKNLDKR